MENNLRHTIDEIEVLRLEKIAQLRHALARLATSFPYNHNDRFRRFQMEREIAWLKATINELDKNLLSLYGDEE